MWNRNGAPGGIYGHDYFGVTISLAHICFVYVARCNCCPMLTSTNSLGDRNMHICWHVSRVAWRYTALSSNTAYLDWLLSCFNDSTDVQGMLSLPVRIACSVHDHICIQARMAWDTESSPHPKQEASGGTRTWERGCHLYFKYNMFYLCITSPTTFVRSFHFEAAQDSLAKAEHAQYRFVYPWWSVT